MQYSVYILQSQSTGRYYCGHTSDLKRRLAEHNDQNYLGSKTTKRFQGPWDLRWSHQLSSRAEAMALEKQIKNRGIKRHLEKVQSV